MGGSDLGFEGASGRPMHRGGLEQRKDARGGHCRAKRWGRITGKQRSGQMGKLFRRQKCQDAVMDGALGQGDR